jgi:hypothetical protein
MMLHQSLLDTSFNAAVALTPGGLGISFGELPAIVAAEEERPV